MVFLLPISVSRIGIEKEAFNRARWQRVYGLMSTITKRKGNTLSVFP